jgi:ethanolamine utilization protein EutQ (cupin superfamily)
MVGAREAARQDRQLRSTALPYHVAGRLAIKMDDGTEFVAGPGDITSLPSGHDAWVMGDEPVIVVDWFGASNYAKR